MSPSIPEMMSETQVGDVYQLDQGVRMFGGALLVVTAVKSWGVTGAIWAPNGARYYPRAMWEQMVYVGRATCVAADYAVVTEETR